MKRMAVPEQAKILTVVGARPQFIKAAAVSRAFEKWNAANRPSRAFHEILVHTGQHYDDNMSRVFFEELHIPEPAYHLGVGSDTHGRQTGKMLAAIEGVLEIENPRLVLIYGDTNSTLAGALAAVKRHIPVAHVEAGLRSFNRRMPEEINRIVADELSQILFCPTLTAMDNLRQEGIEGKGSGKAVGSDIFSGRWVVLSGDVMADSLLYNGQLAEKRSQILERLGVGPKTVRGAPRRYVLVTVHRAENADAPHRMEQILEALRGVAERGVAVVFPMHPRTLKNVNGSPSCAQLLDRCRNAGLILCEPLSYLDMIRVERNALAILTDSGGVQKEAFLLGVPCLTLRDETEWVETVWLGWNVLVGADPRALVRRFEQVLAWNGSGAPFAGPEVSGSVDPRPYGDGRAAETIVGFLADLLFS